MPSLFQDNFDYGDIRRDFVTGVLTSDLLMKNIYCYVVKDGYAARVADTRSYDSVRFALFSFDISVLSVAVRLPEANWSPRTQQRYFIKMDVSARPRRQSPWWSLV